MLFRPAGGGKAKTEKLCDTFLAAEKHHRVFRPVFFRGDGGDSIFSGYIPKRIRIKIFRLVEKKRAKIKIADGQNRWLSATRAFISVRRVFGGRAAADQGGGETR